MNEWNECKKYWIIPTQFKLIHEIEDVITSAQFVYINGAVWTGLVWLRIGTSGDFLWMRYEPSGSIKCWDIIKWLHDWWPLEKFTVPQSWLVYLEYQHSHYSRRAKFCGHQKAEIITQFLINYLSDRTRNHLMHHTHMTFNYPNGWIQFP
jgi:hypothetical protein